MVFVYGRKCKTKLNKETIHHYSHWQTVDVKLTAVPVLYVIVDFKTRVFINEKCINLLTKSQNV